jgi:hypothetical protein
MVQSLAWQWLLLSALIEAVVLSGLGIGLRLQIEVTRSPVVPADLL